MRLQRVSCRNPRHPARCMRSEPCLFSNPPEFQRAFPVPLRMRVQFPAFQLRYCFAGFPGGVGAMTRSETMPRVWFSPFRRPSSQRLLRVFLLPATVATRLTSTAITGRLSAVTTAALSAARTTWTLRLPVPRWRTTGRACIPCVVSVACAREQANPLFKNAEL